MQRRHKILRKAGIFLIVFPIWIPVIFCVVVAEYFDRRAGSQKNRDDGGGGMSWSKAINLKASIVTGESDGCGRGGICLGAV